MFSYFGYFPLWFHEFLPPNILVKIFVKIKRLWTHFIFTRKIILLNWWLNRFWLGLWNTRNLPRQFPNDFLQITPNSNFQIFWPFDLVTLDNILRATRKLANILFPAPNTRLKKDLKVTPLRFLPSVQRAFKG